MKYFFHILKIRRKIKSWGDDPIYRKRASPQGEVCKERSVLGGTTHSSKFLNTKNLVQSNYSRTLFQKSLHISGINSRFVSGKAPTD